MSPTLSKIYAGHKSKNNGRAFEGIFQAMCLRSGIGVTRIPDGCVTRRNGPKIVLIRTKSPWDWVLSYEGCVALIDTKTCTGNFPHSSIDRFQVAEMGKHDGSVKAGYVIWRRDIDLVYFIPSTILRGSSSRGSIITSLVPERYRLGSINNFDLRKIL